MNMSHLNFASLNLGDAYGICKYGSWGHVSAQGEYTVTKKNKMKVTLTRGDGHARVFSVKTGNELNSSYSSRDVFVLSLADYRAKQEQHQLEVSRVHAWAELSQAAQRKNLTDTRVALEKLKSLGVEL